MAARIALLVVSWCGIAVAGACIAQDATLPAESSFIIRLADDAIFADGAEAVRSREYSRSVFASAFLHGYSNPDSTIPVNAALSSSRMNGAGWNAGQVYRRAHPESVPQIMQEYGYTEFEGTGDWTVGFEAGLFKPDRGEPSTPSSPHWCWSLGFIHSADLDAQLARIVPRDVWLRGATLRVHVEGYISELGRFGHLGACQRQVYAVGVVADGG
jgi:hypothetical protein